jgi:hypothetical protein
LSTGFPARDEGSQKHECCANAISNVVFLAQSEIGGFQVSVAHCFSLSSIHAAGFISGHILQPNQAFQRTSADQTYNDC